jgi:tRNA-(ms[2]io[6]A)-hydroxylase
VEKKRRLPVLKTQADEGDEAEARPPWQWVGFGALAIFVVWVPLAYLTGLVMTGVPAVAGSRWASLAVGASGLALASLAGGFLVGRWGGKAVGVREASLAGFAAALIAWVISLGTPGAWAGFVTVFVAVPFAWLGGRVGLRRRMWSV